MVYIFTLLSLNLPSFASFKTVFFCMTMSVNNGTTASRLVNSTKALYLFTDSAIDEVDPIEEIHHVHRQPIIEVLALGQLHHLNFGVRSMQTLQSCCC